MVRVSSLVDTSDTFCYEVRADRLSLSSSGIVPEVLFDVQSYRSVACEQSPSISKSNSTPSLDTFANTSQLNTEVTYIIDNLYSRNTQ